MNSVNKNTLWGDIMEGFAEFPVVVKEMKEVPKVTFDEFPSLSTEFKQVKPKRRVHAIIDVKKENEKKENEKKENIKTMICKNIKEGKECVYGNNCIYAHYLEDISPKECSFKDQCYRIKYTKSIIRNVDNTNPCGFLHPDETIEMFAKRQGANPELMKKPDLSVIYKNTRMCKAVLEGKTCENISECTYAHVPEDLRISPCLFGNNCHNVIKNDEYENKEGKKCFFIHPEENEENYRKRLNYICKNVGVKREADVNVNIDNTIVKKPKIEEPIIENVDDCFIIESTKENAVIIANSIVAAINSGVKNLKIKIKN